MAKYKYGFVDAQYILTTNMKVIQGQDSFDRNGLARSVFNSFVKIARNVGGVEKLILFWDKAPYHKQDITSEYKANREYYDEDGTDSEPLVNYIGYENLTEEQVQPFIDAGVLDVEAFGLLTEESVIAQNLSVDSYYDVLRIIKWEKERVQNEVRLNGIKQETKWFIINEFEKLGIPSIYKQGYEADDLILAWSRFDLAQNCDPSINKSLLMNEGADLKRSVMATADGDWPWFSTPLLDYYHTKKEQVMTYEDILELRHPESLRDKLSLYEYGTIVECLDGGHNNLDGCLKPEFNPWSWEDVVIKLLETADISEIVTDKEIYEINKKTFAIEEFPEYEKVYNRYHYLNTMGSIPTVMEFNKWKMTHGCMLSDNGFHELRSILNPELYQSK